MSSKDLASRAAATRKWRQSNPESARATDRRAYLVKREKYPEKLREQARQSYIRNARRRGIQPPPRLPDDPAQRREIDNQHKREWRQRNRAQIAAAQCAKRARLKNAVPVWADLELIELIYIEAKHRKLEVDHIIPLSSPLVCGLHVHNNMQLLPRLQNILKANRFVPGDA